MTLPRTLFVSSLLLAALAAVVACEDDGREAIDAEGGAPDAATGTTDGSSFVDASSDDEPDARAPFEPADEPVTCTGTPCAVQLVAGDDHFCARMNDGTARCWGSDDFGALGRGDGAEPEDAGADAGWKVSSVVGLTGVVQLSAAGTTTCARLEEGGIWCWGGNDFGQLGLSTDPNAADFDPHPTAAPVALERDLVPTRVDVGHRSGCVTESSGKIQCWGNNEQAQLARPDGGPDSVLGPAGAHLGVLAIARVVPAAHTTLAVTKAGEVWSWGALGAPFGTVGGRIASISPDVLPSKVGSLANVTSIAVSAWLEDFESPEPVPPRAHACAIAGGEVYCWGQTYRSALCTGVPDSARTPAHAPVSSKAWPQQVAVGDEISCVRLTDGTVQCCGEDIHGRLGTGTVKLGSNGFVPATTFKGKAVHVATSNEAVCALVQGGTVECWGSNELGELGQEEADALDHPSPLPVRF